MGIKYNLDKFKKSKLQLRVTNAFCLLCSIILFAIFLTSVFLVDLNNTKLVLALSPQPLILILHFIIITPYFCKGGCRSGGIILSSLLLLMGAFICVFFLAASIFHVIQVGCVNILSCNNSRTVYVAIMILVGILTFLELIMVLYLIIFVRKTVNDMCKMDCKEDDLVSFNRA